MRILFFFLVCFFGGSLIAAASIYMISADQMDIGEWIAGTADTSSEANGQPDQLFGIVRVAVIPVFFGFVNAALPVFQLIRCMPLRRIWKIS
ncbi:MAG: hypothetical protein ACR2NP_13300 [Pirellulaceae bacterium]